MDCRWIHGWVDGWMDWIDCGWIHALIILHRPINWLDSWMGSGFFNLFLVTRQDITAGYNREKLPAYFTNPWPLLRV
jgi:hypothetical protein